MALLDVTTGSWGQDDDHPKWCKYKPWRARCPHCKGKGKLQFQFGGTCEDCMGKGTLPACKEHETYWSPRWGY